MVNTTNTGGTSTDNIIELRIPNTQGSDREPDLDVTNVKTHLSSNQATNLETLHQRTQNFITTNRGMKGGTQQKVRTGI